LFAASIVGSVPPTSWASWSSVARAASAATIPLTVIAMLAAASAARAAVPAARGEDGRRAEIAISQGAGWVGASASVDGAGGGAEGERG
jgi:hypothetical protein